MNCVGASKNPSNAFSRMNSLETAKAGRRGVLRRAPPGNGGSEYGRVASQKHLYIMRRSFIMQITAAFCERRARLSVRASAARSRLSGVIRARPARAFGALASAGRPICSQRRSMAVCTAKGYGFSQSCLHKTNTCAFFAPSSQFTGMP